MILPRIVRDLVDFVYPGRCAACGEGCDGAELLCHRCSAGLDNLAAGAACRRCAAPVVSDGAPCPWCRGGGIYPFQQIARLGRFDEPLREIIHAMKYHRRWGLARAIAGRLMADDHARQLLSGAEVLIPVPLHWGKHIGRGYNQSELLAAALARRCKIPVSRAVRRRRATISQTGMHSRTEREENVRGAFSLRSAKAITGRRVLVVDDVMTTGATLQAVGRAIMQAKPANLDALVLAVADPRGRGFELV